MGREKKLIIGITGNVFTDQRMQRIASALQESGWQVSLYYRPHYKFGKPSNEFQHSFTFKTVPLKPVFNSGILFYLNYNLLLFFKLLFNKADVYYAVDSDTLPAFTLLSLFRAKKLVYDAHEYFSEVPELKGKKLKKYIWHLVCKAGVRRATVCITVGETLAEELSKRYGKKFHCIRNVPELNPIKTQARVRDKPLIIYQGALNAGRELEMLIRCMKQLPEFHCILCGEGDLSATLRAQAAGMSNVEFAGLMSPAALKELSPSCFAGYNLLNAEGSLSYYYSLSNKYFDYMHAAVPSVSSELPEYIRLNETWHCGVCIPSEDERFIALMRDWYSDKAVYGKLKENAMFAAAQNNWNSEKHKLVQLLDI